MDDFEKHKSNDGALSADLELLKADLAKERSARILAELALKLFVAFQRATEDVHEEALFFERTLDLVGEVLKFERVAVLTLEPATGLFKVGKVRGGISLKPGHSYSREQGGVHQKSLVRGVVVLDPVPQEQEGPNSLVTTHPRASVPIFYGTETVALLVADLSGARKQAEETRLLGVIGDAVSTAYRNCRMRSEMQRRLSVLDARARRLDLLNRVTRSLTRRLNMDDLLEELLRLCAEAFDVTHCAILLLDSKNSEILIRRASQGYDEERAPVELPKGHGITGHVASTGVPVLVPDVTKDPRYVTGIHGGRAEMAVPIKVFGQLIGVFDVESAQVDAFDEEDLDVFSSFAASAAVAIHNTELAGAAAAERRGPR